MHVEIVYALPAQQHRAHLELEDGACVADALSAVNRLAPFSELALDEITVGVYGKVVPRTQVLYHGDRLELYRPLLTDPKEARRRRAAQGREGR